MKKRKGSALVLVLTVVAFLLILSASLLSAAYNGYKLNIAVESGKRLKSTATLGVEKGIAQAKASNAKSLINSSFYNYKSIAGKEIKTDVTYTKIDEKTNGSQKIVTYRISALSQRTSGGSSKTVSADVVFAVNSSENELFKRMKQSLVGFKDNASLPYQGNPNKGMPRTKYTDLNNFLISFNSSQFDKIGDYYVRKDTDRIRYYINPPNSVISNLNFLSPNYVSVILTNNDVNITVSDNGNYDLDNLILFSTKNVYMDITANNFNLMRSSIFGDNVTINSRSASKNSDNKNFLPRNDQQINSMTDPSNPFYGYYQKINENFNEIFGTGAAAETTDIQTTSWSE